jgi:type III secretion protein W
MDRLSHVNTTHAILAEQKLRAQQRLANIEMNQETTKADIEQFVELNEFNPLALQKQFETLEKKFQSQGRSAVASQAKTEKADEESIAKEFETNNPELSAKVLMILSSRMGPNDSIDEMMRKLSETYKDPSLADEAIDFLMTSKGTDLDMVEKLKELKSVFNELFGRDIRAGKNIAEQAREFSEAGLGTPTGLRDLYRDIVANPRDPHVLFDELTAKFPYSKLKTVIEFVLHSLGADMKAGGPSISREELERLFTESRIMQAFEGLYAFFQKRMNLITGQFDLEGLTMPGSLTFELLAKQLMKLLKERYPSSDKVIQLSLALGISGALAAQIIIYTQYRDAMRNISPRLFKSERHRQDLLLAIVDALGDLEDLLDEEEEKEE